MGHVRPSRRGAWRRRRSKAKGRLFSLLLLRLFRLPLLVVVGGGCGRADEFRVRDMRAASVRMFAVLTLAIICAQALACESTQKGSAERGDVERRWVEG